MHRRHLTHHVRTSPGPIKYLGTQVPGHICTARQTACLLAVARFSSLESPPSEKLGPRVIHSGQSANHRAPGSRWVVLFFQVCRFRAGASRCASTVIRSGTWTLGVDRLSDSNSFITIHSPLFAPPPTQDTTTSRHPDELRPGSLSLFHLQSVISSGPTE